jgi:hypothetical protein
MAGGCPSRSLSNPIQYKSIYSIGWGRNVFEGIENGIDFQG